MQLGSLIASRREYALLKYCEKLSIRLFVKGGMFVIIHLFPTYFTKNNRFGSTTTAVKSISEQFYFNDPYHYLQSNDFYFKDICFNLHK